MKLCEIKLFDEEKITVVIYLKAKIRYVRKKFRKRNVKQKNSEAKTNFC
jgi:hypothetical protein